MEVFMDISQTKNNLLFRGMTSQQIKDASDALLAREQSFSKGEIILHAGSPTQIMGIVLSGSVTIEIVDFYGNRTVLSHIGRGGFFAETYAMLPGEVMLVDAVANEDCRVLFLNLSRLAAQKVSGSWVPHFTGNLLTISMNKNLTLSKRSLHTTPKSIRARVLSYLNSMCLQKGSQTFDIPFDRQQLADYLNVERTALSKELGRMKKDGLISCRKNRFTLIEPEL